MTRQELANIFGVSRQTIHQWQRDGAPLDKGVDAIQSWLSLHRWDRWARQHPADAHWQEMAGTADKLLECVDKVWLVLPAKDMHRLDSYLVHVAWLLLVRASTEFDPDKRQNFNLGVEDLHQWVDRLEVSLVDDSAGAEKTPDASGLPAALPTEAQPATAE